MQEKRTIGKRPAEKNSQHIKGKLSESPVAKYFVIFQVVSFLLLFSPPEKAPETPWSQKLLGVKKELMNHHYSLSSISNGSKSTKDGIVCD